jgi:hypothetical protein
MMTRNYTIPGEFFLESSNHQEAKRLCVIPEGRGSVQAGLRCGSPGGSPSQDRARAFRADRDYPGSTHKETDTQSGGGERDQEEDDEVLVEGPTSACDERQVNGH